MNAIYEIDQIRTWLDEKLSHDWLSIRKEASIDHEWKKNMGGRIMRAGLTVSMLPAESFSLVVVKEDGLSESYVNGAISGLLSVLVGLT